MNNLRGDLTYRKKKYKTSLHSLLQTSKNYQQIFILKNSHTSPSKMTVRIYHQNKFKNTYEHK